jgi:nucleoside-diphosphate-sugar epimerase
MERTAFLLGGSGQIGLGVARTLALHGWRVIVCDRSGRALPGEVEALGLERRVADRRTAGELQRALGAGTDLLVDCVAFDAVDAHQLVRLSGDVGSIVAISSASVYVDDEGRALDEAETDADMPRLPVPVAETQPTVAAGDATYSTRKRAIEEILVEESRAPCTVIRPGAIHGPGSRHAREWYFLKRALDGRRVVILAYHGESILHTTSVANLAELIHLSAEQPGTRILNSADPDPPNVGDIARLVYETVGDAPWPRPLAGPPPRRELGGTPWSIPHPFVLDTSAAGAALGYQPVTTYESAVSETCRWLRVATRGRNWEAVLPQLAAYPWNLFDYEAEDRFLGTS